MKIIIYIVFFSLIVSCIRCSSTNKSENNQECKENHNEYRMRALLNAPPTLSEMDLVVNNELLKKLLHFGSDPQTDSLITALKNQGLDAINSDLQNACKKINLNQENLKSCDVKLIDIITEDKENQFTQLNESISNSHNATNKTSSISITYPISSSKSAIFEVNDEQIVVQNIILVNDTLFFLPWTRIQQY